MRTDLTNAFKAAKNANARKPRQLAHFHFAAGTRYLSDQALGAADGLSHEYEALVEDWGELIDMAGGDATDHEAGEIRQLTMSIWNGGGSPFSDLFLQEDPENVTVDLYQWAVGLGAADMALIDTLVVQDPIGFDEASRLLRLDLVSLSMRYDPAIGDVLNADDWPNALEADLGKGIDIILGSPDAVPCLCAKTAPRATLNGSILPGTMDVAVHEDLDKLGFGQSGVLILGEEKMRFSGRTASVCSIVQRGYLSEAAEHLDGDTVMEEIDDYVYLVGRGPLGGINAVKVGGVPAPAGIYGVFPELNPARIIFSEPPYSVQYAKGSTFLEMQFDAINDDNTAWQAFYAYDAANGATAAKINQGHPKLSLCQVGENADRGEIVKVYLVVEHWESSAFVYDYAEVAVDGIGVLGRLSRPNVGDTIDVDAEVDIDHAHTHQIAGDHTHLFTDPTLITEDGQHAHGTTGISTTTTYYPSVTLLLYLYAYDGVGDSVSMKFSGSPTSWDNATLTIECTVGGVTLRVRYGGANGWPVYQTLQTGQNIIGLGSRTSTAPFGITIEAVGTGVVGGNAYVKSAKIDVTVGSAVEAAYTGVQTTIQTSGANSSGSDKSVDDVDALETDNVSVVVTDVESATRSIANLFDITESVDFDWGWFTGRDVSVEYVGANDQRDVYILHCFFDVEYRKKGVVFSDDVTCEPEGLVDDGRGTITGTPAAAIDRPDHVRKWLLCDRGGLDGGTIDATSFADAGTRYAALGYVFDGVLDADLTVRKAEKKLARQCRSRWFWNAGLAKIAVRELLADWSVDRAITADDLRLKSISVERQRVSALCNTIRLWYARDWTRQAGGSKDYRKSKADSHGASVDDFGTLERRDAWLFDLVADDDMAADLLAFYLETSALPSIFYTFEAYLKQFDIEKEDIVSLTSAGFHRLRKAPMAVRSADRFFGSGKLRRINTVRIVAECLRYFLIEHTIEDTVRVAEAVSVEVGLPTFREDITHIAEELFAALGAALGETATVSDVLTVAAEYVISAAETVAVSEVLAAAMNVGLADTAMIADQAEAWRNHGFGGGGFGESGFGGFTIWRSQDPDEQKVVDELTIAESAALADAATVSDELLFGSGFGGPFTYFGQSPFGG